MGKRELVNLVLFITHPRLVEIDTMTLCPETGVESVPHSWIFSHPVKPFFF